MDGDDLRVKAASAVADAIRLDTSGDWDAAANSYDEAASALKTLLASGLASHADCASIDKKVAQYTRRAEQLRTSQFVTSLPEVPDPLATTAAVAGAMGNAAAGANSTAVATTVGDPSKASVSSLKAGYDKASAVFAKAKEMDATYNVTTTIGCAAVATYEGARSLEEDYQLSSKVKEGAIHAYESAISIEEEYHVSQNVVEGVRNVADTARQVEVDYRVSERVATTASSLYEQAVEFERQNKIRERMYVAMEEGWEVLKDAAAQAAEYERQNQLAERAKAALLENHQRCCENAKAMMAESSVYKYYIKPATPPVNYPPLPPNADI
mmetsp:Transcript_31066/g.45434  ORF Transcript_31066/g.45434 Transcript_31066/m.45434 type:complete len:326 (-) Transcript_31066:84-1061(-)